jgi:oligopeptidase B
MRDSTIHIAVVLCFFLFSCKTDKPKKAENLSPPVAAKKMKTFLEHGKQRVDDYFWLSNPNDSDVIRHLKAENTYTQQMLAHTEGLQNKLYTELSSRLEKTKQELPVKQFGYWYYRRYQDGEQYPLLCRKKETWGAAEEVYLDVSSLAKKYSHYELKDVVVSPDNQYLAFLIDTTGERRNTLLIKNLTTGGFLPYQINDVSSDALQWANDSKTLFYVRNDATVRGYQAMRHTIQTSVTNDVLIYEEKDNRFVIGLTKSQSNQYIFIGSYSNTSGEFRYLDANKPDSPLSLIQTRTANMIYDVNHFEGAELFFIHTNHRAKNFKIATTPLSNPSLTNWKTIIPESDSSFLEDYLVLRKYLIIQDRSKGQSKIRILNRADGSMKEVGISEEAYVTDMSLADLDNFDTDSFRLDYQSMTTPASIYSYNIKTDTRTILYQAKVQGYNIAKYESKRIWVKVRDGVDVPLSIVYRKDLLLRNGNNPFYLFGYGSYGGSLDPYFQSDVISLLERGFVFGIAHVRGGQELGRSWYENGKLLKKKNSFNDFVDVAEYLIRERYTASNRLFAHGASAGGMLVAAAINQRPDLFRGIIAEEPWTDVLTDMFNENLPLTTLEYDEWGNPNNKIFYDYMRSWSPYDNVKLANYPAILAFGSLFDTQVPYYSPAKWVQRLRANNTGTNPILFKCDMGNGHNGKSGRFEQIRMTALQYAFMLDLLGFSE